MMVVKMLEFETPNGNMYAWDDEIGLFIPLSPTLKAVMKKVLNLGFAPKEMIIEQLKGFFDEEEIAFCCDWLEKWEKIKPNNFKFYAPYNIHVSDLRNYILKRGLSQLTLCVTEDCNFRCKYCAFSDFYEYTRSSSNNYMNFATAKKAIDYFFLLSKEGKRYNPLRKPVIGFYGGEPLLNFHLIKECVEYIDAEYHSYKPSYVMTTNGSLLDSERANWLIKHNFIISVSLDGPEEEHNRLRVYSDGEGTFRDVMKNIAPIVEKGYKNIYSLPVFDWKCDFFEREEFFNKKNIPAVMRASLVVDVEGCRYYEQFTKEDFLVYFQQIERARAYYFKHLGHEKQKEGPSFFDKLVGESPGIDLFGGISIYPRPQIMPLTGACIPGTKIFVDIKGNYHLCERVNSTFPIGNVKEGLNFEKINKLINEYINHMDKCIDCKVSRKCNHCYQMFMTDKGFSYSSKVCEKIERTMIDSFINTFIIAETNPEFVEKANYKYENIKKHYGE